MHRPARVPSGVAYGNRREPGIASSLRRECSSRSRASREYPLEDAYESPPVYLREGDRQVGRLAGAVPALRLTRLQPISTAASLRASSWAICSASNRPPYVWNESRYNLQRSLKEVTSHNVDRHSVGHWLGWC